MLLSVLWYTGRKVVALLITLLIASFVIFAALTLAPGDPAVLLAGNTNNPETLEAIRKDMLLDQPLLAQYWHWLSGLLTGDLGTSYVFRSDVAELVIPRIGTTLMLVVYSTVLILVLGIGSGILAALGGNFTDRLVTVITTILMGAPTFVVGMILITVFALYLDWFPIYGTGTDFVSNVRHLTLPAIAMSCVYLAFVSRVTRTAVRTELYSEHVDTARVRGIAPGRFIPHHVLRNASAPILAVSGITIAGMFAATAVAEQIFGVSGIGSLLVEAASRQDLPVVQVIALFMVAAFVVVNTVIDLINVAIDPRLAQGAAK